MFIQWDFVYVLQIFLSSSLERLINILCVIPNTFKLKWNSVMGILLKDEIEHIIFRQSECLNILDSNIVEQSLSFVQNIMITDDLSPHLFPSKYKWFSWALAWNSNTNLTLLDKVHFSYILIFVIDDSIMFFFWSETSRK